MATSDYGPLLVKGIQKIYDIVGGTYEPMGKNLFHEDTINTRYRQMQRFGGYGLPQTRGEGAPIPDGALFADFGATTYVSNFGLKDVIPNEAIEDDVAGMLTRWAAGAGSAMAESYATNDEILAANFLMNVGFVNSPPVNPTPDGQPIFSLSHPVSRVDPTNLQANTFSVRTPLSMAGLQGARANLEQQKKANGLTKIKNKIRRVIINPNLEEIALQLQTGDWAPGSANRDKNTLQGKFEVFSWPYWEASGASDPNAFNSWFAQGEEHFLIWVMRKQTSFREQEVVAINSTLFASFQRQNLAIDDWRGLVGDQST